MARRDDPEVQFGWLLEELCVGLGFCLPSREIPGLRALIPHDPEAFTDAVFAAEGMDPLVYPQLRRQVREMVGKHLRRWVAWAEGASNHRQVPTTDLLTPGVSLPDLRPSLAAGWTAAVHEMARETGSRVTGPAEPPGPGRNHYRQPVILSSGEHVYLLLNSRIRLVACQLRDEQSNPALPFLDVPRPDLFGLADLYVAEVQELEQPLLPRHTIELFDSELRDIEYHRPARIGDVIYNWFD